MVMPCPTLVKNSWTAYPRWGRAARAYEYLCIETAAFRINTYKKMSSEGVETAAFRIFLQ